jgi:tripartite-type tricarboxylate transporter receptor subunit TctC
MRIKSSLFKTLGIMFAFSAVFAVLTATAVLAAKPYPSKPVRIILPDSAGSGTDVIVRLVTSDLSQRLGNQVIVENRGGGGGIAAAEMVAKADPDGHTLYVITAKYTIQPALEKLPYDPVKAFAPVTKLGTGLFALTVHPSVSANSVKELIALAKQKPGQLIFVSSGTGSSGHMSIELFKMMAGIDFKIVQFKGAGPALTDLLGGHSQSTMISVPAQLPYIKSGKLRALGTSGAKRSMFLPEVPTIAEAGVPGYSTSTWYGFSAPAGTPAPIIDRLDKELKIILASDEVKQRFYKAGLEVDYMSPNEFGPFIDKEMIDWASVVKKANIKLEN